MRTRDRVASGAGYCGACAAVGVFIISCHYNWAYREAARARADTYVFSSRPADIPLDRGGKHACACALEQAQH